LNIQVDGGISDDTIERVAIAGANSIVAGSSLFKAKDMKESITHFRQVVDKELKK
jgi:ribulose-phosphate 3-epimerase